MNWTSGSYQDSRASSAFQDNPTPFLYSGASTRTTDATSEPISSSSTAATAVSGSIAALALLLLLVGLLSMALKKWRHERLFKKQLRHQARFHKSSELSRHADAIYANVLNLAPLQEDVFTVYANVPSFNRPRRPMPDQVEYAAIVFH